MLDKIRNFFNFDCNIYIKVEDDKPVIKYVRSTESSVLHQCDACREMTDKYTKNGENTAFEITESNLTVIKEFFEEITKNYEVVDFQVKSISVDEILAQLYTELKL